MLNCQPCLVLPEGSIRPPENNPDLSGCHEWLLMHCSHLNYPEVLVILRSTWMPCPAMDSWDWYIYLLHLPYFRIKTTIHVGKYNIHDIHGWYGMWCGQKKGRLKKRILGVAWGGNCTCMVWVLRRPCNSRQGFTWIGWKGGLLLTSLEGTVAGWGDCWRLGAVPNVAGGSSLALRILTPSFGNTRDLPFWEPCGLKTSIDTRHLKDS